MRGDLPAGKAAAQAIHGALDSFASVPPPVQQAYRANGHGPVIVLVARDEAALRDLYRQALAERLPCALFIDENCGGLESATCLGLGPVMRDEARCVTEGLPLMK